MQWRTRLAALIAPEVFQQLKEHEQRLDLEVNSRVADVLLKMDPFEPFLKQHNVVFSEEWERPEDKLNDQSQLMLCQWAYGLEDDPNWKYLTDWIRNTQGNATLRKATNEREWFYGRAAIITIELLIREVRRLSSRYRERLQDQPTFDANLSVE